MCFIKLNFRAFAHFVHDSFLFTLSERICVCVVQANIIMCTFSNGLGTVILNNFRIVVRSDDLKHIATGNSGVDEQPVVNNSTISTKCTTGCSRNSAIL